MKNYLNAQVKQAFVIVSVSAGHIRATCGHEDASNA